MVCKAQYISVFHAVFKMQNCSGGVNSDCIAAANPGEEWMCFFAQVPVPCVYSVASNLHHVFLVWHC